MKSSEIEIMRVYLCALDKAEGGPFFNEVKINDEDLMYGYLQKMIAANMDNTKAKAASFAEGSDLDRMVTDDPDDLEAFAEGVCRTVTELVSENAEMRRGTGVFVFFIADEQPFVGFFKIDFQEHFVCRTDGDLVKWGIAADILPKTGGSSEFFIINVIERTVKLSDSEYYFDGDRKVNYLADRVLGLTAEPSEKERTEKVRETTIETIRECYKPEEVASKVLEYKKEVAEHVKDTGKLSVAKIEQAVFDDNEEARALYREKLSEERIPREPMAVSPKTERAYQKKQKIVTDNGIELLVPVEYLKNDNVVEYLMDDAGNITIVIKEIHAIKA